MEDVSTLHIAMFPWFALGHITPFLHVSNKLAQKGHKISFFIPTKTQSKIDHFNRSPHLITFIPIAVPHVDGLPSGAETTSDVPNPQLFPLITAAMERTEPDVEILLRNLKPDIVFFDFAHWIPKLARPLGIRTVFYCIISPLTVGYSYGRVDFDDEDSQISEQTFLHSPPDFPESSAMNLHLHETRLFVVKSKPPPSGSGGGTGRISLLHRLNISLKDSDALAFKACREIEGPFIEYLERKFRKPLLLAGPVIPEPPVSTNLDEKWVNFLGSFKAGSVIYCALGSEWTLTKDQFQELLLGFELSGSPFLAVLKPPHGSETVEEALPEGFGERVGERGVVHGGWIQQRLILEHPSVGCFVTHCGSGSVMEGLLSKCELVMIPHEGDHFFQARLLGKVLEAGVEVERAEEDGFFTRESVRKAVRAVMEENDSEIGRKIKANRVKYRELLLRKDLESFYVDDFSQKLKTLLV
ncbi:hypothetical protein TIFTF001_023058 [Ficus carica]|uniref:Glycosyltransferase n=1 Tax=Ficus carica TaxID=3494 RepID=A0AA88DC68_FICCA|nr:hypothetical protein TIFTF001_023058 [Ficus carica]